MTTSNPDAESQVKTYLTRHASSVNGYIHPVDAVCFASILLDQRARGIAGSLAEIGVFYGRSFFLMALAAAPGERLFAADLFDIDQDGPNSSGQLRSFLESARRFGVTLDERAVFMGPSETLSAQSILDVAGPVRFFSVDGGHMIEHVRNDSGLAMATLANDGVIAFDDFCNPEWPEVSLGVFDFLREQPDFAPFAITRDKLYVARRQHAGAYRDALRSSHWLSGFQVRQIQMMGGDIVWVHQPMSDRIIHHALTKAGLPSLAYSYQASRRR